jgi:uncharacterized protein (DUF2237 family)
MRCIDYGCERDSQVELRQSSNAQLTKTASGARTGACSLPAFARSRGVMTSLRDHRRSGQTGVVQGEMNVFGDELQDCSTDPVTGFYRDGCCTSGPDQAAHLVCAVVTAEFLEQQRSIGNDLITPAPAFGFPGLQPGDRWCVVAQRWLQAHGAGVAPPVVLASTNVRVLQVIDLAVLQLYAVDVPEDLSSLE